jgi:hypothetical protein
MDVRNEICVGAALVAARIEPSSMNPHGALHHPGRDKPCPYIQSESDLIDNESSAEENRAVGRGFSFSSILGCRHDKEIIA